MHSALLISAVGIGTHKPMLQPDRMNFIRIYGFDPAVQSMPAFREQKGLCYPEEAWNQVNTAVQNTLQTGVGYQLDVEAIRKGNPIWVTTRGEVVRNNEGRIVGLRGTVQNITERKKAEQVVLKLSEDMAARNLDLESVNKEMESFIYSVSHDLRAPIRTMSGFAKFVMEGYADKLDDEGKNYLFRIQSSSEKMARLIEDLLKLSRINRQEIVRIETDLSNKASTIIMEFQETNLGRNVEVIIQPSLKDSMDPVLDRVVLLNLLGNAWKFTSKTENANIEFGATKRDEKVAYFVKDNGAGFDPTYSEKMFLPFHRLHSEQEFEGTGIGLAIVERIIHRHGGKIWAEGDVNKGATFYFTLN